MLKFVPQKTLCCSVVQQTQWFQYGRAYEAECLFVYMVDVIFWTLTLETFIQIRKQVIGIWIKLSQVEGYSHVASNLSHKWWSRAVLELGTVRSEVQYRVPD